MRPLAAVAALVAALCLLAAPAGAADAPPRPPRLDARAWVLIEARSGTPLVAHAAHRRLPIASATKLMTAHLALDSLPPGRIVTMAPYYPQAGESLLGVPAGGPISVRDLLYGLVLRSGNDAANTLAVRAAGSVPRFVRAMNRSAAALGLADTHYSTPIGLDAPGNYSSAYDLAVLGRRLLAVPLFRRIADSRQALLGSLRPPREIETINDLLLEVPWADGVKTGHTSDARYVLVGAGRRRGVQLISVVLGAPSEAARDEDTVELLDYGFSLYRRKMPLRRGREAASVPVRYQGEELPLVAGRSVAVGVRRGQRTAVSVRAPDEVEGPVRRGRVIGRATVSVDGRRVAVVPLRAGHAVAEASAVDRVRSFIGGNPIPLGVAACVILVGALLPRRLRRRGQASDATGASPEERRKVREQSRRERDGAKR